MPPKVQKAGGAKGKAGDDKQEELFRAIVLADSFETRFTPFTLERPRCLLPLANTPLLEYTLEFLASAGVDEIYMYAGRHVDQVEAYLETSKWRLDSSPFRHLHFLRDDTATCVGDVMRNLDSKHIFDKSADFLVVSGDVVCDFPIAQALRKHKARREKNKDAIMTMLLREVATTDEPATKPPLPTFVIDPVHERCLHYEEQPTHAAYSSHVDAEVLDTPEVDIRQDLVDCRIDICAPDVLTLYSDNFDHQSPRKDFLYGVLKDHELNGKTIHTYIVQDHFAARVSDLPVYANVTKDIIAEQVPSLAVDNNLFYHASYQRSHHGPTCGKGVIKARPVEIDNKTVLGPETSVGTEARIQHSILGSRCNVGKRCQIRDSYIWDDVMLGANVKINKAVVGSETFIGDDCTLNEGALISFGVRLAPGTNVPAGMKVTRSLEAEGAKSIGGSAFEYLDEDEEDDYAQSGLLYMHPGASDSVSTLGSEASEPDSAINGSRSQSFATNQSDDDTGDRFQHDTVAILLQRMHEGHGADDMLSELMGLRFSGGADEVEVRRAVATALSKRIISQVEEGVAANEATRRTLSSYHTLVRRPNSDQTTAEQIDFMLEAQRYLAKRKEGAKVLLFLAKDLYDLEVFGEESILAWWSDSRSKAEPEMMAVREQTVQFIEWLEEAEEESEDEDEDDD
jgi:translation initiation factor eIF-2B subunit epsilon